MNVVIAIGTRPDVLKMMPLAAKLRQKPNLEVRVWWSGQGKDMFPAEYQYLIDDLGGVVFSDLNGGVCATMSAFNSYLQQVSPDLVMVHGDDATAFSCGLAAFHLGIPIAHIEAGLRTREKTPYPEEAYRVALGQFARYHFAPDNIAKANLIREGINPDHIAVVGNTANDAVLHALGRTHMPIRALVTLHRRENAGEMTQNALDDLAHHVNRVDFTVIRHPNWQNHAYETHNLRVIDPIPHSDLLNRITESDFVVTDSGGLQEECAFLGIPCIVYRESTERAALLESGAVILAEPSQFCLRRAIADLVMRRFAYGSGDSAEKIADIVAKLG